MLDCLAVLATVGGVIFLQLKYGKKEMKKENEEKKQVEESNPKKEGVLEESKHKEFLEKAFGITDEKHVEVKEPKESEPSNAKEALRKRYLHGKE